MTIEEKVFGGGREGIKDKPSKILLVNPPSGFLLDQKVFLPLGIANVASVAREKGYEIGLVDLSDINDYTERVVKEITTGEYSVVGITATSPQFYYAYKILKEIRFRNLGTPVIIGGSHASMFSALRGSLWNRFYSQGLRGADLEERICEDDPNFYRLEEFDAIAEGEESSLFRSLEALKSGKKWVNGGVTEDLDSLPLPARDLFDVKSYLFDPQGSPKFVINGKPSGSLISQRGCPYTCEFCCGRDSEMYKKVKLFRPGISGGVLRALSPARILKELDEMHERFGLESFMFYDDEFNLHPQRTLELCDALKKREYRYRGFVKSDLLTRNPEVARVMKEAGFVEVLSGIESGSERILSRHLHKRTSPELNYKAAMIALENGLGFKALTMLGHTSETERDILDTRDWLLKVGEEYRKRGSSAKFTFDLTIFQPYAGCPIWDKAERNHGEFSDRFGWAYYSRDRQGKIVDPEQGGIYFNKVDFSTEHGFYKGVPGEYKAFIRTRGVSAERYVQLRDDIEHEIRDRLSMVQLRDITKKPSQTQFEHSMGQK